MYRVHPTLDRKNDGTQYCKMVIEVYGKCIQDTNCGKILERNSFFPEKIDILVEYLILVEMEAGKKTGL